ncbi:MAG TPA: gamma-glutamyltransferase [Gemmataceae bacterium]|nr:gamma-glutamyltransferase [Gemmataceae bacterium]
MEDRLDRRDLLKLGGSTLLGVWLGGTGLRAQDKPVTKSRGSITGQTQAAQVGARVLAEGGNAVDAAVAAALVAGVVAINQCGIGGYGGHLIIALPGGKKVTAIDFNSAAPAAARPDMFPLDASGKVPRGVNVHGWLAVGVPGTLAGLQLTLDRYGSQPLSKVLQPAIRYAREGFPVSPALANAIRNARGRFAKDRGSAKLFLKDGEPIPARSMFCNPDLADLLQSFAERNSVEAFYRGEIARRIAGAFKQNGGLVTEADLNAYQAREVEPLKLVWRNHTICTAPLTAGGLTVLEALTVLKAMGWENRPADDVRTTHALIEALRLAWRDRLTSLGDPEQAHKPVPIKRFLDERYARALAQQVEAAVKAGRILQTKADGRDAGGTVHLSVADSRGMLVALTLTHGESFGAQVTVDGLGLILGHGMSRFDPRPDHPNAPGPRKRPLHNMCPTVVLKDGLPSAALGAAGGRRIPNALVHVLANAAGRGRTLQEAVAAPRLHTDGSTTLTIEKSWPKTEADCLAKIGYEIKQGPCALLSAVAYDVPTAITIPTSR